MYQTVKGTYDLLPEELAYFEQLEDLFKLMLDLYGYSLMKTPVFEYAGVFKKDNDTSDMVTKEMYTFSCNGKDLYTLRPEGTAGIVRSLIQNKLYIDTPVKLAYIEEMFRHERPQKGRQRQFTQMGVENFGVKSPLIDAETIALGYNYIKLVGLSNIKVLINTLGDNESRKKYAQALNQYFVSYQDELCDDCKNRLLKNPLRILDCKIDKEKDFVKKAPKMKDYLTSEARQYFIEVKNYLDILKIPYSVSDSLVRGLDYYTDTVFEVVSTDKQAGAQATIFAGGRYDDLVSQLGGPSLSGIGFAIGLERLLILAKAENVLESVDKELDCYIIDLTKGSAYALEVAELLRQNFYTTELNYYDRSMKAQFKTSDRKNALNIIIIGEDELNNHLVTIKNTLTKKQDTIKFDELIAYLKEREDL